MLPLVAPSLTTGYLDTRYLRILQNLADLNNFATARTNLGLVAGGAGDIWVEKAGDTMTGALLVKPSIDVLSGLEVQDKDANVVVSVDTVNNRVGIGTAAPSYPFHSLISDAATNTVTVVAALGHDSSGVPVAAYGTGLLFLGKSSTTVSQSMAQITGEWSDATHATRTGDLVFYTVASAGALTFRMKIGGTAGNVGIGAAGINNQRKLNVYYAPVATTSTYIGVNCDIEPNPSGASSGAYRAMSFSVASGNANGFSGEFNGVYGSISHPYGGTIATVYGFRVAVTNSSTGIMTNVYNFHVDAPRNTGAGSITNLYGLYINDVNVGSTLNYAIYTKAGLVRHGDQEELEEVDTITGAVADGYAAALTLDPGYTAATPQTVTRHNYIEIDNVSVAGVGPAAVTDACVFRFDANAGTHKAVDGASVKVTPGGVDAWVKININGTVYYMPAYVSKIA